MLQVIETTVVTSDIPILIPHQPSRPGTLVQWLVEAIAQCTLTAWRALGARPGPAAFSSRLGKFLWMAKSKPCRIAAAATTNRGGQGARLSTDYLRMRVSSCASTSASTSETSQKVRSPSIQWRIL